MPHSILLAIANRPDTSDDLAAHYASHLTADGHEAWIACNRRHAVSLLTGHTFDVMVLGPLERPTSALTLLRDLRAGALDPRIWADLPTITLAPLIGTGELDALRAYEAGADAHLPSGAGYLHLRAVIAAVARRAGTSTRRALRIGSIEIDVFAREVRIAGTVVELPAKEFALLVTLARDPRRVFTKDELLRDIWGHEDGNRTRTLDSHACRLRAKLAELGEHAVVNVWGVGYRLVDGASRPRPDDPFSDVGA